MAPWLLKMMSPQNSLKRVEVSLEEHSDIGHCNINSPWRGSPPLLFLLAVAVLKFHRQRPCCCTVALDYVFKGNKGESLFQKLPSTPKLNNPYTPFALAGVNYGPYLICRSSLNLWKLKISIFIYKNKNLRKENKDYKRSRLQRFKGFQKKKEHTNREVQSIIMWKSSVIIRAIDPFALKLCG